MTKSYQGRGTAEQWIKEGKDAINWTRLSCHSFRTNEVRLQLHALAYNLGSFLRTGSRYFCWSPCQYYSIRLSIMTVLVGRTKG